MLLLPHLGGIVMNCSYYYYQKPFIFITSLLVSDSIFSSFSPTCMREF